MTRLLAFEVALVGLVFVFAGAAGCSGTGTNQGAADGSTTTPDSGPNACADASVKLIQASDYDQSCTADTDCQLIFEGNACIPCAFICPFGAAISSGALPKYM